MKRYLRLEQTRALFTMHKVKPGVHSWEVYPQQSHEPFKIKQYFTVFTNRYRLILRFEYVRKNQRTESLHCGAVFSKIFWNYRSVKCSIYGVIFGHDQGQNDQEEYELAGLLKWWRIPRQIYGCQART